MRGYYANRRYGQFTPKRRAALRKAALVSAQKRHAKRKRLAINTGKGILATAAVGAVAGAAVYRHKASGSTLTMRHTGPLNRSDLRAVHGTPISPRIGHRTTTAATGLIRRGVKADERTHRISIHTPSVFGHKIDSEVSYRHRSIKGHRAILRSHARQNVAARVHKRELNTRRRPLTVHPDTIPLYNMKGTKGWPHLGASASRRQIAGLRERGMVR